MAVFLLVFVAPVLYAFYLSLFQNQMVGGDKFVGGGANYLQALGDPQFWDSVIRVAVFLVVQVPHHVVPRPFRSLGTGQRASPRDVVLPHFSVPPVRSPGSSSDADVGDSSTAPVLDCLAALTTSSGWIWPSPSLPAGSSRRSGTSTPGSSRGYNMLIFYSALKVIPAELYEAANLDGAGTFRVIRSIKLPSIRGGAIGIASIFSVIGSFQLFNEPNILKALAPNSISSYFTPNMYAFNLSFAGQQFNYAAAISIIMGVLTVIVAYVVQLSGSRKDA